MMSRIVLTICLFSMFVFPVTKAQASASVCVKDVCVSVEVVSQPEAMQRGLQGRDSLADNHGMLFVFKDDDFQRFWMKDMKFAIDIVWIDDQHRIVTIAASRPPCESGPCEVYSPSKKARYVLEVPSGFMRKNKLKEGNVFEFKGI